MSHNTITREFVYHGITEPTDRTTIQTPTFVMQPKLDHSNTDWETCLCCQTDWRLSAQWGTNKGPPLNHLIRVL